MKTPNWFFFKERVSTAIIIDVSIHILFIQLLFWGDKNVLIPEHLISLLILSSQFCVSCSQLWVVFPKLFVSPFESTFRLDPLYPCAWQTKFLSVSFQLVTHRSFHLPLLKISIDPLDGKPFIMRKRTEKSKKRKNRWELWLVIVRTIVIRL